MKSILIDYSNFPQPVLLLMRVSKSLNQWRLNYNIIEEPMPIEISEQQVSDISTIALYSCNYVPAEGGIPGNPPPFEDYVILLKNEGCTELEIESIKSEYQSFIESNF